MVQHIKDEIKDSIMKAGKAEFLEKGFNGASIRKIAAKANVSKSNIYNYFSSKNELFIQILKPTMDIINGAIMSKGAKYNIKEQQQTYTFENQKAIIEVIMKFIYSNKDDFILLLFKSEGSSYDNFRDLIKNEYSNIMQTWLEAASPNNKISRFFIESVASFYINTISEFIIQNKTTEEVKEYFSEFLSFVYGGWNQILRNEVDYE